jgi:hypothetical protein
LPRKKGGDGKDTETFAVLVQIRDRLDLVVAEMRSGFGSIRQLLIDVTLDHDQRIRDLDARLRTLEGQSKA